MKRLIALLILSFAASFVSATNKPTPTPTPTPQAATSTSTSGSASTSTSKSGSIADSVSSAVGGPVTVGGSGDFYVLPAPSAGSNLPAGMCQTSQYRHTAIGWNFVSKADGDSKTELECLKMLIDLERMRREPVVMPAPKADVFIEPICRHPATTPKTKAVAKRVCKG